MRVLGAVAVRNLQQLHPKPYKNYTCAVGKIRRPKLFTKMNKINSIFIFTVQK
nr:MAG TPA: hypothetical protein [Bacteriophage sp.]